MHTPLDGTNTSSFTSIIVSVVLIILVCVLVVLFGYWGLGVLKKRTTFLNWMSLLGCIEIAYAVVLVCFHFDAINYFKYVNQKTKIYEENYIDGRDVKLSFPNEKRNLIYIFLKQVFHKISLDLFFDFFSEVECNKTSLKGIFQSLLLVYTSKFLMKKMLEDLPYQRKWLNAPST